MPQSLSSVLVHLIFSTKHREPLIIEAVEPALHAYLAGALRAMGCPALAVGGMPDHVHALFLLARTTSISQVVEGLKTESSKWVKTQGPSYRAFHWQAGYGAFSVSPSRADETRSYIENQKEHHRVRSFQDEYRAFLKRHQIEFDERYVWD
ncbi:MAG: IS200/IS605 family transposase [Isosphaeraceae bacterium]